MLEVLFNVDLLQKLSYSFYHNFHNFKQRNIVQQVLGFALIDEFSVELHTFESLSFFVLYHSYSKIGYSRKI